MDVKLRYLTTWDIKVDVPLHVYRFLNFIFWQYCYTYDEAVEAGYGRYLVPKRNYV